MPWQFMNYVKVSECCTQQKADPLSFHTGRLLRVETACLERDLAYTPVLPIEDVADLQTFDLVTSLVSLCAW